MRSPVLGAALALLVVGASSARAQTPPDASHLGVIRPSTLSLSAYGEVKAAPDMASITLGVQTIQPTAAQAMSANARRMSEVVAALKRGGVDAEDIRTAGLSLSAQYAYQQNKPPQLTGYQASNEVTVTVHDLSRLGPVLDAVVAAGANQVSGISFGLKDPQAVEDQARLKAVQSLQAKARLYAGATGYRLDRLVNLSEGGGAAPEPPRPTFRVAVAAAAPAETPVEPGQLDIRVDISGVYELAR